MTHASDNPKHIPVSLTADTSRLSPGDRQALPHLIRAVEGINPIYLRQMNQDFKATGGIFDKSRGNNFYPSDLTRGEFDAYLERHPKQRERLLSPFTNVSKWGKGFRAIPYSEAYQKEITALVAHLETAAEFVEHDAFRQFLRGRIMAFLTDGYLRSDKEWVQCVGSPIELILGPFEIYEDSLYGIKRDFEGTLGIVLPNEQRMVEQYERLAIEFDAFLGGKYGYTPFYTTTRMTVIDEIVTSGGTLYGFMAMAANLPDDEEIRKTVGSKKTFMRNAIEAKFRIITAPIAERVMDCTLDPKTFFQFIVGHELSHGLRFRFAGTEFGPLASPLEEAKADVFGVLFMCFRADRRLITWEAAENAAIVCIADGLREIRFNLGEAHAVGSLIKYQWLHTMGVLSFEGTKIALQRNNLIEGFKTLGDELYKLTQSRSRVAAESFVERWGAVPDQLKSIVSSLEDLPVDIDPIFPV